MGGVVSGVTSIFNGGQASNAPKASVYNANKGAFYDSGRLDADKQQVGQALQGVQGRGAAQIGGTSMGMGGAGQAQQQQLADMQMKAAKGEGPSQAAGIIGQGVGASLAAQNAAAASARGGSASTTLRNAQEQAAATQQQGAIAAGQAKIQEQQAAQAGLGQTLGTMRGQDQAEQQANAQLQQQAQMANQSAQMQQQALNDAQQRGLLGMQTGIDQQVQGNQTAYEQMMSGATNQVNQMNMQAQMNENARADSGLANLAGTAIGVGALMSDEREKKDVATPSDSKVGAALDAQAHAQAQAQAGAEARAQAMDANAQARRSTGMGMIRGALASEAGGRAMQLSPLAPSSYAGPQMVNFAALSDEREKTGVRGGGSDVRQLLDGVGAHEYRYKDPGAPGAAPGVHVSPMAQELEHAGPAGRAMVEETPDGTKMVNYQRGLGTILAAQANLHERMKKLEGKGGR